MRILITGSRDWTDRTTIYRALRSAPFDIADNILVSGACPTGADRIAEEFASLLGWTIERHPAEWQHYGKRAGFLRNKAMVDAGADICLAFIKGESRGASMTARLAEEAGIETRRYLA